jgi:glycerol uptake facilitator-like aquaporin
MEQQMDPQVMLERVSAVAREVRKSEAFPAIIGGIAGGIAGALMAIIIASRVSAPQAAKAEHTTKESRGFTLKDLAQLIAVITPLIKQAQAWMKEQEKK